MTGDDATILQEACREMEDQEEHLYHAIGCCRELWIESLGMKPILPPIEEFEHVTTAMGVQTPRSKVIKAVNRGA